MAKHVKLKRESMFSAACKPVNARLTSIVSKIEEAMRHESATVILESRRDWTAVLTGESLTRGKQSPKSDRRLKTKISSILTGETIPGPDDPPNRSIKQEEASTDAVMSGVEECN